MACFIKCIVVVFSASITIEAVSAETMLSKPDQKAAKNIFLVSSAALHCDNFILNREKMRSYALENGVATDRLALERGPYQSARDYALQVTNAHITLGGTAGLCAAVVADFGPSGALAKGLVTAR